MEIIKRVVATMVFVLLVGAIKAQYQTVPDVKGTDSYLNPIFAGDYPDPSILKDGNDYYVVHSSFEYYPGLLIWHSTDLINWTPVTNALHKYVGSVWAPDMIKHGDKYYIYFPANNTNYVITADTITGPWTDPVEIDIEYIDPGHIEGADGKRYLYFSNGGYVPLSEDGISVTGEYKQVYDGWPVPREWTIECFCMEGPKFVKRGEYYYMITAEGGTAGPPTSHMIIAARSKSPTGPWENSPYNPIIKTWDKSERWWSKGHGTLFEDVTGKWWMMYHAYENNYYNKGRQTMLEPIEWTPDGWFKTVEGVTAESLLKRPSATPSPTTYSLSDSFEGKTLKPHWKFFQEYNPGRVQIQNNSLRIQGKGNDVKNCSPMLCIPSHHSYTAEVELSIEGNATGGLVLFYNNDYYSGILADSNNILANLRGWQFPTEKNVINKHVYLRIQNIEHTVDMYYSIDGTSWIKTENSLEVSSMHHNVLSGFLSLRIGLCSIGEGSVTFKNFRYSPVIR